MESLEDVCLREVGECEKEGITWLCAGHQRRVSPSPGLAGSEVHHRPSPTAGEQAPDWL